MALISITKGDSVILSEQTTWEITSLSKEDDYRGPHFVLTKYGSYRGAEKMMVSLTQDEIKEILRWGVSVLK